MRRVVASTPVARGYTPARRSIVRFDDGSSAFVKESTDDLTAGWLREEKKIYDSVRGDFLPRVLEWRDDPPALILEDLSSAFWPPPWTRERVDGVRAALSRVHASAPPAELKRLTGLREELRGWRKIAEDPRPFLGLRMCTSSWLEAALPVLLRAEDAAPLDGDRLLHLDVRSDNLCFADRVVLVDWNWAALGNPDFDVGFWLPSLEAEGGPPPESILPRAPEIAAVTSGFFAANAGLPGIPNAPKVREIQRIQLRSALPWAARALRLNPPEMAGVQ